MKVVLKLMVAGAMCLVGSSACDQPVWIGDGPPPVVQTPAHCFSPTLSPELALDEPGAGCPCNDEASQCVSTTYQGRAWDVALICEAGRWRSVEDGPCYPAQPFPTQPSRRDCVSEGQRYSDGDSVPDPHSCNTCQCDDGEVTLCTEIGCTDPCPAGTRAGTSCAACGPTDACEAVESACLTTCVSSADCTDSSHFACVEGLCRNVCG